MVSWGKNRNNIRIFADQKRINITKVFDVVKYRSFGFTELKISEAKLAEVRGVRRSYRPPGRA